MTTCVTGVWCDVVLLLYHFLSCVCGSGSWPTTIFAVDKRGLFILVYRHRNSVYTFFLNVLVIQLDSPGYVRYWIE